MTYRKRIFSGAALALSLAAGVALGADAVSQDFVDKAATAGLYEVKAAELARDKTQDPQVREFADQMIADHGAANRELNSYANQHELMAPTKIDDKHQKMLDKLAKLSGEDFDREYARQQLEAHKEAVKLFENQASSGADKGLKQWANGKVPILKAHLGHAQKLAENEGHGEKSSR
jgi:putative membrane protein